MPPIRAQTSTEVKKAYKKNGPVISERTHKLLERGYELEQRAAREREAEKRRKTAKEKKAERERKEENVRKQLGVGLATQMVGYSHTQARLKSGMEAFLGVGKRKRDNELASKLEVIARDVGDQAVEEESMVEPAALAQQVEKEPFDDDEDIDDAMLELPVLNMSGGEGWVDDDLDDNTLLEVHDLVMSDPVEEPVNDAVAVPPRPATAPPPPQRDTSANMVQAPTVLPHVSPKAGPKTACTPRVSNPVKPDVEHEDLEFTRLHGPINRVVETVLEQLPGCIIELLSQDAATNVSDWNPAHGLLHKLNPIGLPPHRLRIKVGCVVVLLRDLNTSSQLSKSQHVRVLRAENDRLDCLTLDGQLAGTKTVITRVPFPANYRNDSKFPFTRVQYPVRIATDYTSPDLPREAAPSGFKLPSVNGRSQLSAPVKRPAPLTKSRPQVSSNPSFKLPGLPASKVQPVTPSKSTAAVPSVPFALDGWDDFLESSTQIARELRADVAQKPVLPNISAQPLPEIESLPPLSTQDLDFTVDDLYDEPEPQPQPQPVPSKATVPARKIVSPPSVRPGPLSRTANIRYIDSALKPVLPPSVRPLKAVQPKSRRQMVPPPKPVPTCTKVSCVPSPHTIPCALPTTKATTSRSFSDFGMSTQDATSFFDDDDDLVLGSPPIAV